MCLYNEEIIKLVYHSNDGLIRGKLTYEPLGSNDGVISQFAECNYIDFTVFNRQNLYTSGFFAVFLV